MTYPSLNKQTNKVSLCPRMLIVDDEQDICALLKDFFAVQGFDVNSAFSGEEALKWLAQENIDVLLLDILLPGISGIEVLKKVRKSHPKVRVIMVTSLDESDLRKQSEDSGAAAYITKRFNFNDKAWSEALEGFL